MNRYESRRRLAPVVYGLMVLLALPPGWMPSVFAVSNRRVNSLSRDTKLETLRNPQFSSGASNRFMFTMGPQALIGSGGDNFSNPDRKGYGSLAEPAAHWVSYKGRLEWTDNDLMLPGVGLPLIFQRIYRGSVNTYAGPLGNQWEFNWNKRIQYDASGSPTHAYFYEQGRREDYQLSAGSYTSPIGRYDNLTRTGTPEYWRTDREGVKEVYETDPSLANWFRLKTITDLNGNRISCMYDGNSLLTKLRDTLDQDTTLAFDSNDRITSITDASSREWKYSYDGSGYLASVRTPTYDQNSNGMADQDDFLTGRTTTYKYDSGGQLTEILRPTDSSTGTWKWAYDGSGFITKETRDGNDLSLTYDTGNHKVTVVDRESNKTVYFWDDSHEGNLITKRDVYWDATHSYETTYAYDAAGNVTEVVFPRGNLIDYIFDGSGNVLTVSFKKDAMDGAPKTWVYSYTANARLSTLRDPNSCTWEYDYDGSGNLLSKTAPSVIWPTSSHGTIDDHWAYNSLGQVTRAIDPIGTTTLTSYITVNSISAYPNVVTRDSAGLALTTDYDYDGRGNVTQVRDSNNNATVYTRDSLNEVILAVEPGSVSKKTHYDADGRVIETEASNDTQAGNSWFVVDRDYDAQNNVTRLREDLDGSNRVTTAYAFDKDDRLTKVTSPEGNETQYTYDVRDLQASVTRKAASSPDNAITSTTYDENGNRATVTDPRANNTLFAYDGYDRLTKTTRPEGDYVKRAYDEAGNVVTTENYNVGNTMLARTAYTYDQANRLYQTDRLAKKADLSTNIGDGLQTVTMYLDEQGRTLSHAGDACGCSLWTHVYDALGREVTKTDPLGSDPTIVLTEYDKNGNVTKSTRKDQSQDPGLEADKDVVTEYTYDARNRRTTMKQRLDVSTTMDTVYFYGLRDQLTKVVDGNGDEKRIEHNEKLWQTKDIAENGASDPTVEYTYDDDGRLITYRAKNSTTGDQDTLYTYDKLDRVLTTQWPPNPSVQSTQQTYDTVGNRISTTDPNGTIVVCAYDKNNRMTSQTNALATGVVGATSITFAFDGMGRVTSADTSEGGAYSTGVDRTYNTLGKIETEKQIIDGYNSGNGRTISYVYDEKGMVVSKIYPVSGDTIHYDRDALDRVDKVSKNSAEIVDYEWSGPRMIKKSYPGSYCTYLYDGYGRLTDIHAIDTSSGHTLDEFTYGFDKSSQITSEDTIYYDDVANTRISGASHLDEGDQYAYDGAKRLVTVLRGVPTANINDPIVNNITNSHVRDKGIFTYDQTGNRVTRSSNGANDQTFVNDKANQISIEGVTTLSNDNNGNYLGGTNPLAYTWDNHLGRYIVSGGSPVTHTWHFDAFGRKVDWVGNRDFRYYCDGDQEIEHVEWATSTESTRKEYIWGDRIDDLLYYQFQLPNPDVDYYAHTDHLGSVQLLCDSNGAIQESYRYWEWGQTTIVDSTFTKIAGVDSDSKNNVRYAGRDEYTVLGDQNDTWYNNRARAYRTKWGRFVERDPIGRHDAESENLYSYGRQAPLINIDPTGRWPTIPITGTGGGGGNGQGGGGGHTTEPCDAECFGWCLGCAAEIAAGPVGGIVDVVWDWLGGESPCDHCKSCGTTCLRAAWKWITGGDDGPEI